MTELIHVCKNFVIEFNGSHLHVSARQILNQLPPAILVICLDENITILIQMLNSSLEDAEIVQMLMAEVIKLEWFLVNCMHRTTTVHLNV